MEKQTTSSARRRFFDPHMHLWDFVGKPEWYGRSLDGSTVNLRQLKRTFVLRDYLQSLDAIELIGYVQVCAAIGEYWRDEEEWIEGMNRAAGLPTTTVAMLALTGSESEGYVRARLSSPALRGVRLAGFDAAGTEADSALLRVLEERGLSFEIGVRGGGDPSCWLPVVEANPAIQFVLEHGGRPSMESRNNWDDWARIIDRVAAAPNIACKMSGLGMTFNHTDADLFARFWKHCISAFGPERSMFASNFPVDEMYGPFAGLLQSFEQAVADLSESQQADVFWRTASRIYKCPIQR